MSLKAVGGPIDRARVSLRVTGATLIPEEVTRLLGCQATRSYREGDEVGTPRRHRVAKSGMWMLVGDDPETADLEQQIVTLLSRVSVDLAIWHDLATEFSVDILCGVFLDDWNRGFELSPRVMRMLGERGIKLGVDVYGITESLHELLDSLNHHKTPGTE